MRRLRDWAERATPLLLAAGLIALGYAAYMAVGTWTYQNDQRKQFRHLKEDSRLLPLTDRFIVRARAVAGAETGPQ